MKPAVLLALALFVAACTGTGTDDLGSTTESERSTTTVAVSRDPRGTAAPETPKGPPSPEVVGAIDRVLDGVLTQSWDPSTVGELADLGDARVAWLLADLMRFYQTGEPDQALVFAFSELTGAPQDASEVSFVWATNHLLSWDLQAWDDYAQAKSTLYEQLTPLWAQFIDEGPDADWRAVTWGGVGPDQRPYDDNGPCNCIPSLDNPPTTDANGGDWYADDRVVFGAVVNGEAIALPKHQMEFHEMVNLTLGGRELAVPYCTLCASAQAYFVDDVAGNERLVLRTSGLLKRSNKLMYDLVTGSAIDTFTGEALTGELADEDVVLEQTSVIASTWGDWKAAHPDTRILAQDGGLGRVYDDNPLRGRDDDGPIFPIGDVDPRLPIQLKVVGVIKDDGTPIAFPVDTARKALADGPIEYEGLTARLEDGIRIYDASGDEVVNHEAFWFAWSQFHPRTLVWDDVGS